MRWRVGRAVIWPSTQKYKPSCSEAHHRGTRRMTSSGVILGDLRASFVVNRIDAACLVLCVNSPLVAALAHSSMPRPKVIAGFSGRNSPWRERLRRSL